MKRFCIFLTVFVILGMVFPLTDISYAASDARSRSGMLSPSQAPTIIEATYGDKDEFLQIIDKEKRKRLGDVFYMSFNHSSQMDSLADRANRLTYEYITNPDHPPPYDERFIGSIFIAPNVSQISKNLIDQWVKDPRQLHILLYPRVSEVGLSVMSYTKSDHPDMVIGVFLWDRKYVRWPWGDSRYIRLLPNYYETSLLVYTGQVKSEVGFEPQEIH